jgi:hypothetical protein
VIQLLGQVAQAVAVGILGRVADPIAVAIPGVRVEVVAQLERVGEVVLVGVGAGGQGHPGDTREQRGRASDALEPLPAGPCRDCLGDHGQGFGSSFCSPRDRSVA